MIYGCDEAGKGPVLGSMFIACVIGDENDIPQGMKDSKRLSTSRIHKLAEEIEQNLEVSVVEVTPSQIDNSSMTDVSVTGFSNAIQNVDYESCSDGYIDCFINNKETVENELRSQINIPENQNLHVEFGADDEYNIVSAASIIAKSDRERHIEDLSNEHGDIGSGYPSDPNTREFLQDYIDRNGEAPNYARKSWSTVEDMLENRSE